MKNLILVLMVTVLTACGGAEFSAQFDDSIAGEGGEPVASAGSATSGGSSSAGSGGAAGGSTAGKPAMGGSSGSASVGGAASVACEFDPAMLTAALPTEIDLGDFSYTSGELCVACRESPCGKMPVISWGVPTYDQDRGWIYRPNSGKDMVPLVFGNNDGVCSKTEECGTKPDMPLLIVQVERSEDGWEISSATFQLTFFGNACVNNHAGGGFLSDLSKAVDQTVSKRLIGSNIRCQ